MTSRRGSSSKKSCIFPTTSDSETHFDPNLELYEADVWERDSSSSANNTMTDSKTKKGHQKKRKDHKEHRKKKDDDDEDGDGDDGGVMIPPHEYLARTRGAPHSVQEGKGRTLKGRDARNVRNSVWKTTGFEG